MNKFQQFIAKLFKIECRCNKGLGLEPRVVSNIEDYFIECIQKDIKPNIKYLMNQYHISETSAYRIKKGIHKYTSRKYKDML